MHFTEALLLATSPMIQRFHLNFNNIPAGSTCRATQKHQKGQSEQQEMSPLEKPKNNKTYCFCLHF
jgi:hypothetical protein